MAAGFLLKALKDGAGASFNAWWYDDGTGTLYPVSVLGNGAGALIDFTAASPVTQSGAWNITNITGTVSLPTGAATAAKQPALGTAGSSSADVISVQGIASGTALPISGTVSASSVGFDVPTTITRPANTTPYTANDVVGGALDLGVLGPSAKPVMITSAQLELDIAAIPTGMTSFRLYLYNVTPPSAIADNGAWDLGSGDRASYLGYIDLGTPADLGSTLYCEANGINKQVLLAGTHLFGYLVTNGGYTPAANSEVYKPTLHTVAV